MKNTYKGSCHCGSVKFECALDLAAGTTRCNCSFCRKARVWLAFVKADEFRLLEGEDVLTDYRHAPQGRPEPFLHLYFCSRCGIRAFARGGALPQFGGPFCAVNIGCLDDASDEELSKAPVHFADGRNDDWETSASDTRYL